ncbi:NAD-dependent epimerase/dehydratase family protein [bacterium]|nr:NAD-dependent epimerase/dehydratase family protein [bacterium]
MKRIIVTGSQGQIGTELVQALRERYGSENVLATDIREVQGSLRETGPFEILDCTQHHSIMKMVKDFKADTIYHLAALLSAVAEEKTALAWDVGMNGLFYVLEVARETGCSVFFPSSIGAFGLSTPQDKTPQDTIQRPSTMYGVTKVAGELLCDYYHKRFGVDTRGVRYPGIISYKTLPGGGTTDYAVDIYYKAITDGRYTCYLKEGTHLDMMYMPDALKAAIDIMEADPSRLIHRNCFNVTSLSVAPEHFLSAIRRHYPDFAMDYKIDSVRQSIAESWPNSMDDSAARDEWDWQPSYTMESMTIDMLENLQKKLK